MRARRLVLAGLVSLCVLAGGLLFASTSALAATGFAFSPSLSSAFGTSGGLVVPTGLAVDNSAGSSKGDVYVADQGTDVVSKFSASGSLLGKVEEPGATLSQLTVDDYAGPDQGDVLVTGVSSGVVYRFDSGLSLQREIKGLQAPTAVAVDEAGNMFVAENAGNPGDAKILELNPAGELINAAGSPAFGPVIEGPNSPMVLDVSANGETLYVATALGTLQYTISGGSYALTQTVSPEFSTGMTVDGSGNVYVDNGGQITEYDPTNADEVLSTFGGGILSGSYGLGVNDSSGDVYVDDIGGATVDVFESGETPEVPTTGKASAVTGSTATLEGILNAGGGGTSGYYFAYNTGGSCTGGQTTPPQAGSSGPVSAEVTGLSPSTTYTFCLVATKYGSSIGQNAQFTTAFVPPKIESQSVPNVSPSSATVSAQIDADGLLTTYEVRYGPTSAYGSSTSPVSIGDPSGFVGVEERLNGLTPGTEYHYSIVATSEAGVERTPDAVFTTSAATTTSSGVPDGRVYEMVTPPDNEEAEAYVPKTMSEGVINSGEGGVRTRLPFQVATDGNAVVYASGPTVGGNGSTGAGQGGSNLAVRGVNGGWTQTNIQPPGVKSAEYEAFSPDLSVGIIESGSSVQPDVPPLSPQAASDGYPVLYSHVFGQQGYSPFFEGPPLDGLPPAEFSAWGVEFKDFWRGGQGLAYAGGSSGLSELLFETQGNLTENAVSAPGENNLYVSSGGRVTLVNVLPDGKTETNATFGTSLGETQPDFSHVISADGSRVFWTDLNTGDLYVREDPTSSEARTVEVDAAAAGAPGPSGGGQFWTASNDGSRVFFTDTNRLTSDSTAAPEVPEVPEVPEGPGVPSVPAIPAIPPKPDLYEYNVESGQLVDLTVDHDPGEHAGVQGVIGVGEEGSGGPPSVYFVAEGVLAHNENSNGATAEPDRDNLYVLRGGEIKFVAVLSWIEDDLSAVYVLETVGDWQSNLGRRTAEVAPDGRSVVFESANQSVDGRSPEVEGKKLEEVYVYDAENGKLSCASCDPAGEYLPGNEEIAHGYGGFLSPSWSNTYLSQWLSTDGNRVFFDSSEPLVGADTNDTQDVYEWEREGTGSCVHGAAVSDGCVYLVSGGVNASGSSFLGASANGNDVLIISREKFVPDDGNEAYNVFDARVDGVKPVVPPACTGTGCQGVPGAPPTFATPSSVTFNGVGNFPPSSVVPSKATLKKKPLTRAQKLRQALKVCARKPRARRGACERQARRRYGPQRRAKTKKSSSSSMRGGRS